MIIIGITNSGKNIINPIIIRGIPIIAPIIVVVMKKPIPMASMPAILTRALTIVSLNN